MDINEIKKKLIQNGWTDQNISILPNYKLYDGINEYLSYKNKLTINLHFEIYKLRLIIYNINDNYTNPNIFINAINKNNVSCFEFEYKNKLDEVIEKIISIQEELNTNNYISHYLSFQSLCPVAILAVEQFIPGYK